MSSLPEELYQEILKRVPVKPLLVCKCVCKNWYDIISSSDFVKFHLEFTAQKNEPTFMLSAANLLKSISYDSLATSVCEIADVAIELDHPFKSLQRGVQIWGLCNGVFCLRLVDYNCDRKFFYRKFFCLWNPATREYKEIPEPPDNFGFDSICAVAYDHKTDDYKLALGESFPDNYTLVQVYTVASNSWKPGQYIRYQFLNDMQRHRHGVLCNGDLHWLAKAQSKFLLLSLDIGDESFKEFQLPPVELLEKNGNLNAILGMLEGHLCILVDSYLNGLWKIHLQVWEMLDYGVEESWTRRYIITHRSILENNICDSSPIWSFGNGTILFMGYGCLVMYDPTDRSAVKLNKYHIDIRLAVSYFESLVSLKSGTYVGGEGRIDELRET